MKKLIIAAVVVATLASFVLPVAAMANQPAVNSAVTHKAAFHDAMRKLWEDHIIWTRQVIVDVFATAPPSAGLPDLTYAVNRLLQNQVDIGNAIKPYYGDAAGNQLTALLTTHIVQAATILTDLKTGSPNLNADIAAWYVNADEIAVFLSGANPKNWPLATMQDLMKMHLDLTTAEVLARFEGRWADDIAAFDAVHVEILKMADTLSSGIIAQFPQKFAK